jgi:hypothetical protein
LQRWQQSNKDGSLRIQVIRPERKAAESVFPEKFDEGDYGGEGFADEGAAKMAAGKRYALSILRSRYKRGSILPFLLFRCKRKLTENRLKELQEVYQELEL